MIGSDSLGRRHLARAAHWGMAHATTCHAGRFLRFIPRQVALPSGNGSRFVARILLFCSAMINVGLTGVGLTGWGGNLATAQSLPIEFDQRFDRVVLNQENGGASVRVLPTGLSVDGPVDKSVPLRVVIVDDPESQYDVAWSAIERVEFFEDVVLEKARHYMARQKFEDAYRLLAYLWQSEPTWRGLHATTEQFLLRDGAAHYKAGRYNEALVVLEELVRQSKESKKAARVIHRVVDRMFRVAVEEQRYKDARNIVAWAQQRRDLRATATVRRWAEVLQSKVEEVLAGAAVELRDGDFDAVYDRLIVAFEILPDSPEAQQLWKKTVHQYPRLVVGVTRRTEIESGPGGNVDLAFDWSSRRTHRLTGRHLVEMDSYSAQGGTYRCPLGNFTIDEDQRGITFAPHPPLARTSDALLRLLQQLAEDERLELARRPIIDSVTRDEDGAVHVRLRRTPLRWMPRLEVPLEPSPAFGAVANYAITPSTSDAEVRFQSNSVGRRHDAGAIQEIVELSYDDPTELTDALLEGHVDMIDRMGPLEARRLDAVDGIEVRQYAFASGYFLVPNLTRPLWQQRPARRAIVYAINREEILNKVILGGQPAEGCQRITGPFPAGINDRDPIAYAYDPQITPYPSDPALASALMASARDPKLHAPSQQRRAAATESDVADQKDDASKSADGGEAPPPIILACAHDAILLPSGQAIRSRLQRAGIECELRVLPAGEARPSDAMWDLWLTDVTLFEPICDIYRLVGSRGLVTQPSTYLLQSLSQIDRDTLWTDARRDLKELHGLVHSELPIVPLWQLTNHFAYREMVQGVKENPASLYESVESWRLKP